jgi:thiol-disulfide isomerase/thioredoxin
MENKSKYITSLLVAFILVGSVSALNVNYFYSPSCPNCESINPLINSLSTQFSFHKWNFFDVTKGSYNISGVPTIKIETSDCRNIELVGSYEIPKYLKCELQEQSTKECPTHSYLKRGSFFIE